MNKQQNNDSAIKLASQNGHLDIANLLSKNKRIEPYEDNNCDTILSLKNLYSDNINVPVSNNITQPEVELYNILMIKNIKNKVMSF
jgi:hypothetical protein